uniref:Protein-tyrosine-phosphatase n=1 Tax=Mycena chlorophos TaxID=658473 RepID=A0ABQ0LHD8_MYCCL|nr:predicted protein [Mycena chlorophos]
MLHLSSVLAHNPLAEIHAAMGTIVTSEITPRLFVADWLVAQNWDALNAMGITHVVSVCEIPPLVSSKIEHLHVLMMDLPFADILEHFPAATEWIKTALSVDGTKVLVHCLGGLSRSVSIACAYLIAAKGLTSAEAILYLKDRRPVAHPNIGFRLQLNQWAAKFGLHDGQDDDSETNGGPLDLLPGSVTGLLLHGGALGNEVINRVGQLTGHGGTTAHTLVIARAKALGPDWSGPVSVVQVVAASA